MSKKVKVLIVDDEKSVREVLLRALKGLGYSCVTAVDGQEGLEALRENDFDVAMIDLKMPKMDGVALLTAIREENIDIVSVILTAYGEISTVVEAMKLGAFDFIEKPAKLKTIESTIQRAALHRRVVHHAKEMAILAEQWESTFDASHDMIFVLNPDQRILRCNRATAERLGTTKENLVGRFCYEALCGEDHFPEFCPYHKTLSDERTLSAEFFHNLWRGYFVYTVVSLKDRFGQAWGSVHIVHDITERKQAEQELRQSRDKLHKAQLQHLAVLRSTPHGLCMLTSNWIITWANSAMMKILGLKPDKTRSLRTPFKALFANEENFNDYQKLALHSVRTTGIDVRELELRWPDGKPLWCEISIVRIDPHETEPGLVATFSDITERKQAEEELKQSLEKIRTTLEETVNALASAVEIRDPYTAGHQRRVSQLACAVAKEMDMSDDQIEAILMAGLIHDIGKISVPAEILSKPSRLSEMEMNLIKTHPQVSFDILKDIEFPWPVAHIVLQHHERMNGSGYPHGLSGEEILLEARILAVADVVEAMASHRPYRPALGTDKALDEILRNKGILYDAAVVNACAKLLAEEGFNLDKIRVTRERRKWPRVNVELPCEVQLLMPDETFQPRSSHGCIMDLSMRGARVRISSLLKDVFQKLLRPNRYVKLIFSTPESERKLKVIGKIVSMEFKEKEQLLDLRAYFENVEPGTQTVLQKIVEQGS